MKTDEIKEIVKSRYAKVALHNMPCCGPRKSCCGGPDAKEISKKAGYRDMDLNSVPEGQILDWDAAIRWRLLR